MFQVETKFSVNISTKVGTDYKFINKGLFYMSVLKIFCDSFTMKIPMKIQLLLKRELEFGKLVKKCADYKQSEQGANRQKYSFKVVLHNSYTRKILDVSRKY